LKQKGLLVYDDAAAVFFTELCKWTFSVSAMYYRTGKFLPVSVFKEGTWRIGLYFAVPSGIYAVYNNLTYFNLSAFDPGTYQVFMQTRVIFTGVLYTWILSKSLTQRKWLALVLLTMGVAAKYFTFHLEIDHRVVFMLFQASLSAFAGVYNEFLLKRDISMDVNEQNFFMYSFALVFNLGFGLATNREYYTDGRVFGSLNGIVLLIIINGAIIGIVTSLILKFINVIVKAFASACEVLLTAVLAALFLGESLTMQDVVACCIVMGSIYVYYTVPTEKVDSEKQEKVVK
jgi:drug/metabolite transporter (DMT)-like permease